MDLLVVPVPLFDKNTAVDAYYFRYQKGNDLINSSRTTRIYDGAMHSPLLETLDIVGLEAFTLGKPIFVPINSLMLLVNLEQQCSQPADKIIFMLDSEAKCEDPYLANMRRLKGLGYRFGIQKIPSLEAYDPILRLCDFVFFDQKIAVKPEQVRMLADVRRNYHHLTVVMTHIDTMDLFTGLYGQGIGLYEGRFYRTPLTKGANKVSPVKANLIKLLNLVRDENFEFDSVAAIVQRDTALTLSLMRMVNSPYLGLSQKIKTIPHAVTMLGQIEVRRWVTTAVSRLMGTDKPDEITKVSLVRGRFAENLARLFGMESHSQSLFLMGLFSVLDVVLEISMENALKMVRVSDPIHDALLSHRGEYYPIYQFILSYENADWHSISRMMILYDLEPEDIYSAYVDASGWYRDLMSDVDTYREARREPSGRPKR